MSTRVTASTRPSKATALPAQPERSQHNSGASQVQASDGFDETKPSGLTPIGKGLRWGLTKLHDFADTTDSHLVVGLSLGAWAAGVADANVDFRFTLEPHERLKLATVATAAANVPGLPIHAEANYAPDQNLSGAMSVSSPISVPLPKAIEKLGIPYPSSGRAPVGFFAGRDPILGRSVGVFVTGMGFVALYEHGGFGAGVYLAPSWLKSLQRGGLGIGPGVSLRYFTPALEPLTSIPFRIPDVMFPQGAPPWLDAAGNKASEAYDKTWQTFDDVGDEIARAVPYADQLKTALKKLENAVGETFDSAKGNIESWSQSPAGQEALKHLQMVGAALTGAPLRRVLIGEGDLEAP